MEDLLAVLDCDENSVRTIVQNPGATIRPDTPPPVREGASVRTRELLDRLRNSTPSEALDYERTLGQGGMGVVRLATQTSLGRKVAVKALKPEVTDSAAVERLLREAWITGALEHPNVVPVHTVALDEGGRPLIVLKRIEGVHWGELMHDERTLRERFGARDALEWNLRILVQVCDAVRFAHDRGIVHRDLKPENVMVGEFGEVYVLDWGIAVALQDDGTGRFPLAADATDVAGTPAYMAPEMLGGTPSRISERTDVYLLGATLYEILAGHAPYAGNSLVEMVGQIVASQPELPDGAPAELARIVRRAMDPDPDARFENPRQLRLALQGYLQHRDSYQLAHDAGARLNELLDALGSTDSSSARGATDEARRQRLYQLFGACRFGFQQSLRIWGQNDAARDGLTRAIEAMVDYELREGTPEAASGLLADLAAPRAEILSRVERLRREREDERARLAALAQQMDPTVGSRTRIVTTGLLGAIWTVVPLAAALRRNMGVDPPALAYPFQIAWTVGLLVVAGGISLWARDSLSKSVLNRMVTAAALFALLSQLMLQLGCMMLAVDRSAAIVLLLFNWFSITTMLVLGVERRLAPIPLGYLAGFLVAAAHPAWVHYAMAASNLVMTLTVTTAWAHHPADRTRPLLG